MGSINLGLFYWQKNVEDSFIVTMKNYPLLTNTFCSKFNK